MHKQKIKRFIHTVDAHDGARHAYPADSQAPRIAAYDMGRTSLRQQSRMGRIIDKCADVMSRTDAHILARIARRRFSAARDYAGVLVSRSAILQPETPPPPLLLVKRGRLSSRRHQMPCVRPISSGFSLRHYAYA